MKEPKPPSSCPSVVVCGVGWARWCSGREQGELQECGSQCKPRLRGFAIPTANGSPPFLSEEETISELKPAINVPLLSHRDCEITLQMRRSPSLQYERVCSLLLARHCFVGFRPWVPLAPGSHLESTGASNGQSNPGIKCQMM